jgi:hypothetical protein
LVSQRLNAGENSSSGKAQAFSNPEFLPKWVGFETGQFCLILF